MDLVCIGSVIKSASLGDFKLRVLKNRNDCEFPIWFHGAIDMLSTFVPEILLYLGSFTGRNIADSDDFGHGIREFFFRLQIRRAAF